MALVRLTLADRRGEYDDLDLDLFVDDCGLANSETITYGRQGSLGGEPWPFVVRPKSGSREARLDFGVKDDPTSDTERFAKTNLLSKRIAAGELATFCLDGEDVCYQITKAKTLPDGDDFSPNRSGI